jgi:hypothetical protein
MTYQQWLRKVAELLSAQRVICDAAPEGIWTPVTVRLERHDEPHDEYDSGVSYEAYVSELVDEYEVLGATVEYKGLNAKGQRTYLVTIRGKQGATVTDTHPDDEDADEEEWLYKCSEHSDTCSHVMAVMDLRDRFERADDEIGRGM